MGKWVGRVSIIILFGLVLAAFLAVARDWTSLMATGGWFAVFGQLVAVLSTLVLLFLLAALCLALVCLPVLLFFGIGAPDRVELLTWQGVKEGLARGALALGDPIWKALWWAWWLTARIFRR